jgi:hypothetical protein
MLEGWPFTIYTDHKPLTYELGKVADGLTARECQQLSYVVKFTTDIRHVVADTLSGPLSVAGPDGWQLAHNMGPDSCQPAQHAGPDSCHLHTIQDRIAASLHTTLWWFLQTGSCWIMSALPKTS